MDVQEKNSVLSLKAALSLYLIPIIICCIGILISIFMFYIEKIESDERLRFYLEEESEERFLSITNTIDHIIDSVESIKALFDASEEVSRTEFTLFVKYQFKRHKSIKTLGWIPRVPDEKRDEFEKAAILDGFEGFRFTEREEQGVMVRAARRDEYFPVYYVKPLESNKAALGFDLASNKIRLELLNRSRDTGKAVATAKIMLLQETANKPSFIIFEPIYKKDLPVDTPMERRAALNGFAFGVYIVSNLFNEALANYPPVGVHVSIFDMDAPPGETFLYYYSDTEHDATYEYPKDMTKAEKGLHMSHVIEVAGREWRIVFMPTDKFIKSEKSAKPLVFLFFWLIITGMLVFVSVILTGRTQKIKILVDLRTEELRKARDELQVRVEERTKELSESEEKFRSINANATDAMILLDNNGMVIYWNLAAERIFGYESGELEGKDMHKFIAPEKYYDDFKKGFSRFKATGEGNLIGKATETTALRKDGTEFSVEVTISALKIKGKWYASGVVRDITERKKAEEEIRILNISLEQKVIKRTEELNNSLTDTEHARDRIDGILKSVADGLIVTDTYNRVILMNRAAEDLLGVRFSEVVDRPIDFAIKDKVLREKVIETLSKKTTGYQFDFELSSKLSEKPRIMRARTSVIFDSEGNNSGIVIIIHDVTHEREVDRIKTEFISTAAHELRTPLTSIRGFSEILMTRKDLKKEEKKKFLNYINEQSVKLGNIVNDLLDISRIESGKSFTLNKAPCKTGEAIKEIVPYFESISKNTFKVTLPDEEIIIMADKVKMGQVLKNILGNAVKYSPKGGIININAELTDDGYYQLAVQDHGIGMTSGQINKVFDKFFRADTSDSAVEGTGLGMTIVKHIVEAHGGEVRVESEYGKGTTVTFKIPVNDETDTNIDSLSNKLKTGKGQ